MVWWRRGPGWRRAAYSMGGSSYVFDRAALDATALTEVAERMTQMSGPLARLDVSGYSMTPLKLSEIEDWSPSVLDSLQLLTIPDEAKLREAGTPGGTPDFLSIALQLNSPGALPPGQQGSLTAGTQNMATPQAVMAGDELARLVVKLARPAANGAALLWLLPALAALALGVSQVVAATLDVLHPLLWPSALVVTGLAVGFLSRWVRRQVTSRRAARDILILDRRPRKVIEEQRENARQDRRAKWIGSLYTVGAGVVLAAVLLLLRLK